MEDLGRLPSDRQEHTDVGESNPLRGLRLGTIESLLVQDLEFAAHWLSHLDNPLFRSVPQSPRNDPLPREEIATTLAWHSRRLARASALALELAERLFASRTENVSIFETEPYPNSGGATRKQGTREVSYAGWQLLEVACSRILYQLKLGVRGARHSTVACRLARTLALLLQAAGVDSTLTTAIEGAIQLPRTQTATVQSNAPPAADRTEPALDSTIAHAPTAAMLASAARYVWELALSVRKAQGLNAEASLLGIAANFATQARPAHGTVPSDPFWPQTHRLSFTAHYLRTGLDPLTYPHHYVSEYDALRAGKLSLQEPPTSSYGRACLAGLRNLFASAARELINGLNEKHDIPFIDLLWLMHDPDFEGVRDELLSHTLLGPLQQEAKQMWGMSEHHLADWEASGTTPGTFASPQDGRGR